MSNSNYSIGLQRLKPVHAAYGENWSWARDVNGRDRDVCLPRPRRDRDVDSFSQNETETRRWYVSRPSRDRDVETETTTLPSLRKDGLISSVFICRLYECNYDAEVLTDAGGAAFHFQTRAAAIGNA